MPSAVKLSAINIFSLLTVCILKSSSAVTSPMQTIFVLWETVYPEPKKALTPEPLAKVRKSEEIVLSEARSAQGRVS